MPDYMNVYLATSVWSSGIVTVYSNVFKNSVIDIDIADDINYIRIFNANTSTGKISYSVIEN